MKPYEIKERLDEYVVGQESVKKMMAVEFYQKSLTHADNFPKTNMLLCGPTGSGKTFIVETMAQIMNLPYHVIDATSLTQEGYKGLSINEVIYSIFNKFDKEKAKRAIVFIDEIDKLAENDNESSSGIGTIRVQQELLKIIEGSKVQIQTKDEKTKLLDTKNMTFIFGGAFVGIEKIIEKRLTNEPDSPKEVQPQDLIEFGLIPEFVGRIPSVATLKRLDANDLLSVIFNSKKSVYKEYQKLYESYNIELELDDDAASELALESYRLNTGVRGLNQKLGQLLRDIQYQILLEKELPKQIKITKETITTKQPILIGVQSWEDAEKASSKQNKGNASYPANKEEYIKALDNVPISRKEIQEIRQIAAFLRKRNSVHLSEFISAVSHYADFDQLELKRVECIMKDMLVHENLNFNDVVRLMANPVTVVKNSLRQLEEVRLDCSETVESFATSHQPLFKLLVYINLTSQEFKNHSKQKLA